MKLDLRRSALRPEGRACESARASRLTPDPQGLSFRKSRGKEQEERRGVQSEWKWAKEYSQRASEEREREEGAPDHDQALPRHSKGAFPLGALPPPLPSGASMLTKCVGGWRGEESRVRGKEMGGKMAGGFGRAHCQVIIEMHHFKDDLIFAITVSFSQVENPNQNLEATISRVRHLICLRPPVLRRLFSRDAASNRALACGPPLARVRSPAGAKP